MHDNDISQKLKELAAGKNRSATAMLTEIFDQIEVAIASGVRRKDIYLVLVESGFKITFSSFELAIHRIRNKRRSTIKTVNEPMQQLASEPTRNVEKNSGLPFNLDFSIPPQFKRRRDGD